MTTHRQRSDHLHTTGSAHHRAHQPKVVSRSEVHEPTEKPASHAPTRREQQGAGPFSMMRRFAEEMDRVYEGFVGVFGSVAPSGDLQNATGWPQVDVSQRDDKFIVHADIPGLKKEDVNVEVRESELRISGQRQRESEQQEGGYYHSERSYGAFTRTIPLPENAKAETASATFENGVLRIEIEAPSERTHGARRIEVRDGSPH